MDAPFLLLSALFSPWVECLPSLLAQHPDGFISREVQEWDGQGEQQSHRPSCARHGIAAGPSCLVLTQRARLTYPLFWPFRPLPSLRSGLDGPEHPRVVRVGALHDQRRQSEGERRMVWQHLRGVWSRNLLTMARVCICLATIPPLDYRVRRSGCARSSRCCWRTTSGCARTAPGRTGRTSAAACE
jgi:hypothetical protein